MAKWKLTLDKWEKWGKWLQPGKRVNIFKLYNISSIQINISRLTIKFIQFAHIGEDRGIYIYTNTCIISYVHISRCPLQSCFTMYILFFLFVHFVLNTAKTEGHDILAFNPGHAKIEQNAILVNHLGQL